MAVRSSPIRSSYDATHHFQRNHGTAYERARRGRYSDMAQLATGRTRSPLQGVPKGCTFLYRLYLRHLRPRFTWGRGAAVRLDFRRQPQIEPAGSGEARQGAGPFNLPEALNSGVLHVDATSPRRIFRGDKLPRPPARLDVGNSEPPKTAWDQTWRRRFQFGAWRQACGRNSSYRVSRPPRPRGRKCPLEATFSVHRATE
jgi:hypothetical protein